MKMKIFAMALALVLLLSPIAHGLNFWEAQSTGRLVMSNSYRYYGFHFEDDLDGAANGSEEVTVTLAMQPDDNGNVQEGADFMIITYTGATTNLYIKLVTSDGDTSYVSSTESTVLEPDESMPFYIRDVHQVKLRILNDSDAGDVRICYYKI